MITWLLNIIVHNRDLFTMPAEIQEIGGPRRPEEEIRFVAGVYSESEKEINDPEPQCTNGVSMNESKSFPEKSF